MIVVRKLHVPVRYSIFPGELHVLSDRREETPCSREVLHVLSDRREETPCCREVLHVPGGTPRSK